MSIVNTALPMTPRRAEETIRSLVSAYPGLRSQKLTDTYFGRPVLSLVLGTGPRKVLYTAAHHANEWITAPLLLKFAEDLAQAAAAGQSYGGYSGEALLRAATVYMVPMVNPDGVALVTGAIAETDLQYQGARLLAERYPDIAFPQGWKANLLGVDLNLNYPAGWAQARENKFSQGYRYPGPRDYVGRAPLDQPETQALVQYTRQIDPALILAYHTQGQVIYWKYQDLFVPGARELGERFARSSGYTLEDTPFASGFAGYKDWFIDQYRRPGYTVEVGAGVNPLPLEQFGEIQRRNREILVQAAIGLK